MKSFYLAVAVCLALVSALSAEYSKFQWQAVGLKDIVIYEIDVTPMPIIQPGVAKLTLLGESTRPLNGKLNADLNIIRKVAGVALPVRCYLTAGVYVGSCVYSDLCAVVKSLFDNFKPETCHPFLVENGIDCTCPFSIKETKLDIVNMEIELPDASQTLASFLASGDFDISFKVGDETGPFGTIKVQFTVKPKK